VAYFLLDHPVSACKLLSNRSCYSGITRFVHIKYRLPTTWRRGFMLNSMTPLDPMYRVSVDAIAWWI